MIKLDNPKLKRFLCFLNFNHSLTITSIEEGKGTDFRYVHTCTCKKNKEVGNWTDDNHAQGYGTE